MNIYEPCDKCESEDGHHIEYRESSIDLSGHGWPREWMECRCARCGYAHHRYCADHEQWPGEKIG